MKPDYFISILTSAFVAALVSPLFTLYIDWRRRISEDKRFRLDAALKLTQMRDEQIYNIIRNASQTKVGFYDPVHNLIWYLKQIERLWNGQVFEVEKELSNHKQKPEH